MKIKFILLTTCYFLLAAVSANAQRLDTANIISYIKQYKDIAIEEMNRSGIPASITLAQGIHESSYGTSYLSKNTNNHFGIKCKENWTGKTFKYTDDAPNECFRVYDSVAQSYRDHSDFLKYRPRYASLFLLDKSDYKGWARGLKSAGYATNPQYAPILIKTIEDFKLYTFDKGENPGYINTIETIIVTETPVQQKPVEVVPINVPKPIVEEKDAEIGTTITQENFNKAVDKTIIKINNVKAIKVYNGETLDLIANVMEISKEDLLAFNDIKDEFQIKEGQFLFLQQKKKSNAEATYKVKQEDNIWNISQKKGVRLSSLLKMNQLDEGEEPAVKETIYLKGKSTSKPKLRSIKTSTKEIIKPITDTIVRARDTIYPTLQEAVKSASAIDSSKLLGWEKETKLLEKPNAQTYPKDTVKVNAAQKSNSPNTPAKSIAVAERETPTVYPTSIDYNKLPKSASAFHTVIKGDTMYNICKRYNISIAQVMQWNNLPDQNIKLGQVLKIQ